MEENDYLCRSWFKLLIRGSFPSIIAEAVFAKGRLFLRFLLKFAVEMLKTQENCIFWKKSCGKIWRYYKFVIIL